MDWTRAAGSALALWALAGAPRALAQGPTIGTGQGGVPELRRNESSLGLSPGGGGNLIGDSPGSDRPILGGGAGTATPVAPPSISRPGGGGYQNLGGRGVGAVPELPQAELPLFGALSLPDADDIGPPDGLTLDAAIYRLVRENLDLRSRFYEIPQARADILTASAYANPILFWDAQLVPYGGYSAQRPGGPTQYDLNISHPLDLSGKRKARAEVACGAVKVIEAQYQDAVRLEIGNLHEAYLGTLLARETIRFSRAALEGLDQVVETVQDQLEEEIATEIDVASVNNLRELAAVALIDAEQTSRSAKLRLGALLNIPAPQAEQIELRAGLRVNAPPAPPGDELVRLALESRPDLAAYRLGVRRSRSDVKLALANRFADVYVLYQPYTFQDNDVAGDRGSHSWAAGLTVPLPLYDRNQGNIARAKLNVEQSRIELAAQELRVVTEVKQAEKEYLVAREAVDRIERVIRPAAERILETARIRWRSGEKDLLFFLSARRDYNEFVRQYLAYWLRYRRSMLRLNTVVGVRLFA